MALQYLYRDLQISDFFCARPFVCYLTRILFRRQGISCVIKPRVRKGTVPCQHGHAPFYVPPSLLIPNPIGISIMCNGTLFHSRMTLFLPSRCAVDNPSDIYRTPFPGIYYPRPNVWCLVRGQEPTTTRKRASTLSSFMKESIAAARAPV